MNTDDHSVRPTPNKIALLMRFVYLGVLIFTIYTVYRLLIGEIVSGDRRFTAILALWLISAYIFLPRIHRWFSRVYLPNYFIGRVRTYDGILGDPINIAVNGSKTSLISAMKKAGWVEADPLNKKSALLMIKASILRKSYPNAPVSSLFLFNKKQDLAFQKEVDNNPRKRHHVRFWSTPKNWWLPGGYEADWLGAATFDKSVGLSGFTLQITHKIAENTDEERDFVVSSVISANKNAKLRVIKHFTSGYHDRNGGGDRIRTDGSLPFINL